MAYVMLDVFTYALHCQSLTSTSNHCKSVDLRIFKDRGTCIYITAGRHGNAHRRSSTVPQRTFCYVICRGVHCIAYTGRAVKNAGLEMTNKRAGLKRRRDREEVHCNDLRWSRRYSSCAILLLFSGPVFSPRPAFAHSDLLHLNSETVHFADRMANGQLVATLKSLLHFVVLVHVLQSFISPSSIFSVPLAVTVTVKLSDVGCGTTKDIALISSI